MFRSVAARSGAAAIFCASLLFFISTAAFAATLSISANPTTFNNSGQSITLTYTFNSGNAVISSLTISPSVGPAPSCSFSQLNTNQSWTCAVTYTVTASDYSSGFFVDVANWDAQTSAGTPVSGTQTLRVERTLGGSTNTTLSASSSVSSFGAPVTLSATVTPNGGGTPTGTVAFSATGAPSLGTVALDATGHASLTTTALPVGNSYTVYAQYSGDSNFSSSIGLVTHTVTAPSNNATVSNLTLSNGTLSPSFSSGATSYSASVPNSVSSVTVTPTAADANATVTVNGGSVASGTASPPIPLAVGDNAISVVVTAQDGTTTLATPPQSRATAPCLRSCRAR